MQTIVSLFNGKENQKQQFIIYFYTGSWCITLKHASDRLGTLSDSLGVCGLQGDNHECLVDLDDSKSYKKYKN